MLATETTVRGLSADEVTIVTAVVVVTTVGGAVFSCDTVEAVSLDVTFVVGVALSSPESKTAVLGCWTMICMLEHSCRLLSVEGRGAWSGTPPNVSSLGVVTADKDFASGLSTVAEVGVALGLTLETSLPLATP